MSVERSSTFLAAATCALLRSSRRSALLSAVSLASSTILPPNSVNARTNSAKFDTDSSRSSERATCIIHYQVNASTRYLSSFYKVVRSSWKELKHSFACRLKLVQIAKRSCNTSTLQNTYSYVYDNCSDIVIVLLENSNN